jgi:dTDP-4-amino-4,6-dideoxygalactose transaminase
LKVIEDCAQSTGARYKERQTGSLADAAAFSFCQDKILTTCGEGGMLTTNDPWVYERAWSYKDHGKNRKAAIAKTSSQEFRWLHDSFGTNWRMTEVQSAVGREQLRRLEAQVTTRRRNAGILIERLRGIPALRIPVPGAEFEHSYYKFYAFLRPEMLDLGWNRSRVIAAINAEGIPCFSGSCSEIYLEAAFAEHRPATRHPVARELGDCSLMFLVHPTLSEKDIFDTCTAVEKVMEVAALREPMAQIA